MHKLHVTEGVVLMKRPVGEANIRVWVLTEQLGLVVVSAKSARIERSKLRFGLEPFTQGTFSLVRGRYEWKLTGVTHISQKFSVHVAAARRAAAGRVVKLLLRLVQGEEPLPALYVTVAEGLEALLSPPQDTELSVELLEIMLVLRVLSQLGYLPQSQELDAFVKGDLFSLELAAAAARSRSTLIRAINTSLESTGL